MNSIYRWKMNQQANESLYANNDYRNYFTLVYPKSGKEFLIDNCTYENNTIYVKCKGHNLWDESDLITDYTYQWKINFDSKPVNILDILLLLDL